MATLASDQPILFVGLADHWDPGVQPFPYGGLDLFQLARHKMHLFYPGVLHTDAAWVFLMDSAFLRSDEAKGLKVSIQDDETRSEVGNFVLNGIETFTHESPPQDYREMIKPVPVPGEPGQNRTGLFVPNDATPFVLFTTVIMNVVIPKPGTYSVFASFGGKTQNVGSVEFHYKRADPLTPEQIKAVESNPTRAKGAFIEIGCKTCSSKYKVYTALQRIREKEESGWTWYLDADEAFNCSCGKARIPLNYIRESAHTLLLRDEVAASGLSYVRQYAHSQVQGVVNRFRDLLDKHPPELEVQNFIEKNPMLLARFQAEKLYFRPDIIGRFKADFVVLGSQRDLWFIELERPSIKLFKGNGHPTADLMHAYGQVNDWLHQYAKYSGAILESLGLKQDQVVSAKSAVIAGRSAAVSYDALQRHHSAPPYPGVDFLTYDDLAAGLLTISKKLA
jgi:hypothetical protein